MTWGSAAASHHRPEAEDGMSAGETHGPSEAVGRGGLGPPRWAVAWAFLGLLIVADYAWTFHDLVRGWLAKDRLLLGLVVLAGAVYLAWDRRRQVTRASIRPSKWGYAFILGALLVLLVGTRARLVSHVIDVGGMSSVFLRGVSLVMVLCGMVIALAGWQAMRPLWLPAVLLLFIYPENYFTAYWIPLRLQTLAAVVSEKIIAALGNVVVREGHVLGTVGFTANVEEACSGIRALMTVVPAALFMGGCALRKLGTKMALVMIAVPITVLANVFRVSTTVLLGIYVGERAADGFFHYFAGLGVFLLCLVGLVIGLKVLALVEDAEPPEAGGGAAPSPERTGAAGTGVLNPLRRPRALAIVGGVVVAGLLFQVLETRRLRAAVQKYPADLLDELPWKVDGWEGRDASIPAEALQEIRAERQPTDWLCRQYRAPQGDPLDVVALYWMVGAGTLNVRRGHSAEVCLLSRGMKQVWSREVAVRTGSDLIPEVAVRMGKFSGLGGSVLVTSWQQAGPRPISRVPVRVPDATPGKFAFGVKAVLWPGRFLCPELLVQISSACHGDEEDIVRRHRDFAAALIPRVVEKLLLWTDEGERAWADELDLPPDSPS